MAIVSSTDTGIRSHREAARTSADSIPAGQRVSIICNDADYFLRHRRITADALARQARERAQSLARTAR